MKDFSMFNAFAAPFMNEYFELQENMESHKEKIKNEYQKTYTMPRKMKKQRRKELNLDWQIANWDFGF